MNIITCTVAPLKTDTFLDKKQIYSALQKFLDTLLTTEPLYSQNSSHPMQYNQFSAKNDAGYQTIWIEDQEPRFVGPNLDPYCLQRSLKINIL